MRFEVGQSGSPVLVRQHEAALRVGKRLAQVVLIDAGSVADGLDERAAVYPVLICRCVRDRVARKDVRKHAASAQTESAEVGPRSGLSHVSVRQVYETSVVELAARFEERVHERAAHSVRRTGGNGDAQLRSGSGRRAVGLQRPYAHLHQPHRSLARQGRQKGRRRRRRWRRSGGRGRRRSFERRLVLLRERRRRWGRERGWLGVVNFDEGRQIERTLLNQERSAGLRLRRTLVL